MEKYNPYIVKLFWYINYGNVMAVPLKGLIDAI